MPRPLLRAQDLQGVVQVTARELELGVVLAGSVRWFTGFGSRQGVIALRLLLIPGKTRNWKCGDPGSCAIEVRWEPRESDFSLEGSFSTTTPVLKSRTNDLKMPMERWHRWSGTFRCPAWPRSSKRNAANLVPSGNRRKPVPGNRRPEKDVGATGNGQPRSTKTNLGQNSGFPNWNSPPLQPGRGLLWFVCHPRPRSQAWLWTAKTQLVRKLSGQKLSFLWGRGSFLPW